MHQARDSGFTVTLFFIALDSPEKNILRVLTRVQSGGHDVPSDRIVARYMRTLDLLPQMVEAAHRSYIFDNSALYGGPDEVRRLVAFAEFDGEVVITVAEETPAWVNHYLVKPAQRAVGAYHRDVLEL
jgi:predicted ABC-type ATPase